MQLLLTIVQEMERRQATTLAELPADGAGAFAAMWADLRRPGLWAVERLFFECYARAAQGRAAVRPTAAWAVAGWLSDVEARTNGRAERDMTRLGLAVTRGLLLDLVATGDVNGVDAAAARFTAMLRRR